MIRGCQEQGEPVAPFTSFAGLYKPASAHAPFALPPRWVEGRDSLDLASRYN
jgi:hypothetical protein